MWDIRVSTALSVENCTNDMGCSCDAATRCSSGILLHISHKLHSVSLFLCELNSLDLTPSLPRTGDDVPCLHHTACF